MAWRRQLWSLLGVLPVDPPAVAKSATQDQRWPHTILKNAPELSS